MEASESRIYEIEITYLLTSEQYLRLQEATRKICENFNPKWTEQMALQYAVGTLSFPFDIEDKLALLEADFQKKAGQECTKTGKNGTS